MDEKFKQIDASCKPVAIRLCHKNVLKSETPTALPSREGRACWVDGMNMNQGKHPELIIRFSRTSAESPEYTRRRDSMTGSHCDHVRWMT